jgi:hypothetical protein
MRCVSIPGGLTTTLFALLAGLGAGACAPDPYGNFNDPDRTLGPVDPVLFPPGNLGTGGDRKRPGRGRFSENTAYVKDDPVGYFAYTLPPPAAGTDPLRLREDGKPYDAVPTPAAYVFETVPGGGPPEDRVPCTPPDGYTYVAQRDDVDYTRQGAIFAALPEAGYTEGALPTTKYVPVVSETQMVARDVACQQLKSVKRMKQVMGNVPPTTGKFLAWLVIDPAAPVYPRDNPTGSLGMGRLLSGIGLQGWGWYNRYLLAYIDGGYLPTDEAMAMSTTTDPPAPVKVTRMRPQRLFVPRQIKTDTGMAAGKWGAGYDVLEARRGEAGYSPLCQIWNYGDPAAPLATADLPRNVLAIMNTPGLNPAAATPASYIFCLQVAKP